ncbi:hypothetical protein [Enterovibrio nigricans]|uniref:Uncharacterized protein n=1 Tax=Enterovibrio nigricans DSM 22720 TaxID=1121868 RepID=A0A1T4VVY6_9GAMM|nr:hypothetical protein [Enterovibrio nigricans]PKF49303.1 hypothetical protein AT251_19900 [Enterovibrio nigricans]SKA69117.1 hypothetical protein SAMN02745132_04408 [Enterovibrio nigricans DSM 22720]
MTTQRTIKVNIPNKSLLALKKGGYKMVIFRGVASLSEDTKSTVFMSVDASNLQEQNEISWNNQYYGFTSKSSLVCGGRVHASSSRKMDLGDVLTIGEDSTTLSVTTPNDSNLVEQYLLKVHNDGESTVCGFSMTHPHTSQPAQICAASIPGKSKASIMPLDRYMVMFTSNQGFDENVAVSHITSNSAIIDFNQHVESREVTYNYDSGLFAQGCDMDSMFFDPTETNGWLSNTWNTIKKAGKVVLNDTLNIVGKQAVNVIKEVMK